MTKKEFKEIQDYLQDLDFSCTYRLTWTTIWTLFLNDGNADIEVLNPDTNLGASSNEKPITLDVYTNKSKMNSLITEVGFDNLKELKAYLEEE